MLSESQSYLFYGNVLYGAMLSGDPQIYISCRIRQSHRNISEQIPASYLYLGMIFYINGFYLIGNPFIFIDIVGRLPYADLRFDITCGCTYCMSVQPYLTVFQIMLVFDISLILMHACIKRIKQYDRRQRIFPCKPRIGTCFEAYLQIFFRNTYSVRNIFFIVIKMHPVNYGNVVSVRLIDVFLFLLSHNIIGVMIDHVHHYIDDFRIKLPSGAFYQRFADFSLCKRFP